MAGWLTDGVAQLNKLSGAETLPLDTNGSAGATPQFGAASALQLATAFAFLTNTSSKTTVAGTRYAVSYPVGFSGSATGVQVLMGSAGGTDKFVAELHDSTGALVATSATAGQTTGAANTVMQIPFTAAVTLTPQTYYIVIQSNGTTDHPLVYNGVGLPIQTSVTAGVFGTGAAITPPTAYTAAQGPVANLY